MARTQRDVNTELISATVDRFLEDGQIVATGESRDVVTTREIAQAVDTWMVIETWEEHAPGGVIERWRPLGTDALLRRVIVDKMSPAYVATTRDGRGWRGVKIR